jgi:hypothetical protein
MSPPAQPGPPDWLVEELRTVPEIDVFAGADELAAESARLASRYSGVISSRVVGRSAGNEPLACLTIHGGRTARADALVYGSPHPNEPAGCLTSLHLAERLAADRGLRERLGLTWHIVPTIDPDGLRLNEGWLHGPFTQGHYTRHFYRQASVEQIDWNFPVEDGSPPLDRKRPPETLALMRLIDRFRPALLASLHNSEIGDVYYYLDHDDEQLIAQLQRIPGVLGMSLYRGIPESDWARGLGEGVYRSLDILHSVEHDREAGHSPEQPTGNSSSTYAARHDALSLISEVPYWRDARTADGTPSRTPFREALAHRREQLRELSAVLGDAFRATGPHLRLDSPFLRAARHFARSAADDAVDAERRAPQVPTDRFATVAELASVDNSIRLARLRTTGLLLRALDAEIAHGDSDPAIRTAHSALSHRHAEWGAEAERDAARVGVEANPIGTMVAMQYGAILAAADHLVRTRRSR